MFMRAPASFATALGSATAVLLEFPGVHVSCFAGRELCSTAATDAPTMVHAQTIHRKSFIPAATDKRVSCYGPCKSKHVLFDRMVVGIGMHSLERAV